MKNRKHNYLQYIFLPLFALMNMLLYSCSEKGDEPDVPSINDARRTVLVYMSANNNLARYAPYDIEEMEKGVKNGALKKGDRLLVFHETDTLTSLKEVTSSGTKVLKTYPQSALSVQASTMKMVLDDVETLSPHTSFGMILWGHGSGWFEDGIAEPDLDPYAISPLSYGYSKFEDKKYWMNTSTMARVLEGRGLDFLYFDCCLMMSVETMYELRHTAPYIVGSPSELGLNGMPYDRTLKYFFADGDADLIAAASTTFDYYCQYMPEECTMSVVKTSELDKLADATRAIYELSYVGMPSSPFEPQIYSILTEYKDMFYDFGHYVDYLATNYPDLANKFDTALNNAVIYKETTSNVYGSAKKMNHYSGLTTYILPNFSASSTKNYGALEWWNDVAKYLRQ